VQAKKAHYQTSNRPRSSIEKSGLREIGALFPHRRNPPLQRLNLIGALAGLDSPEEFDQLRSRIDPLQHGLSPNFPLSTGPFPGLLRLRCHRGYSKTGSGLTERATNDVDNLEIDPSWMPISSERMDFLSSRSFGSTLS